MKSLNLIYTCKTGSNSLPEHYIGKKTMQLLTAFLMSLTFIALFSCGDSSKIRLNGNIDAGEDRVLYFDKLQVEGSRMLDSVLLRRNGNFSFSTTATEPSFYRLRLTDNNFIILLAGPGENITLNAGASNLPGTYTVEGSEGSELLKKLNDRLMVTRKQMEPLIEEIMALEEGPGYEEEEARINRELEEIIKAQRDFSIAFILDNMESMASITALYQMLDDQNYVLNQTRDIQFLKIVAEALVKKYPQSPHVRSLATDAENLERRYELHRFSALAEQRGDIITTYPEIAMPGRDGDTIRLRSLPQKYKLVLFGSSLNPASVQLSHELIPVYNAYRNKGFEIFQVSVERSREEWLRSIEFSELPWVHVAEFGEGSFSGAQNYNVQQIPANYLINHEVGVVARNLSPAELRRRLSRALDQ